MKTIFAIASNIIAFIIVWLLFPFIWLWVVTGRITSQHRLFDREEK